MGAGQLVPVMSFHELCQASQRPLIGGLLAFGDRGTGKSTAVRALAALLPEIRATSCAYHCDPDSASAQCDSCRKAATHKLRKISIPVVDLPLPSPRRTRHAQGSQDSWGRRIQANSSYYLDIVDDRLILPPPTH